MSRHSGKVILRWIIAVLLMVFPTRVIGPVANAAGHRLQPGARIGFSVVSARQINMSATARIGHFNLVNCDRLVMRSQAKIGTLNYISGPIGVWLQERGAVGNRNTITRAARGIASGPAVLKLGRLSKITAGHSVDCTASVIVGEYTVVAGKGSQIWTHGYVHDTKGPGRYRVDGKVLLGNNVYIGSRVVITSGISIGDGVILASGMSLGRSLPNAGFYVSAPMRQLPRPTSPQERKDLLLVVDAGLTEKVFRKTDADR